MSKPRDPIDLVFHTPESGGYTVATLNGQEIYRGDDYPRPLLWALMEALNIKYKQLEYRDDLYEEKFS